ncbi:uncharacterized protein [Clytia hemisphaerica]|uniref:Uncharacterized protein n=1 Tax=Clytia hemisphaerica TaxID=252671 RepID=A0A7M5WQ15_9CNID|eukprot:TCONS_00066222-protein
MFLLFGFLLFLCHQFQDTHGLSIRGPNDAQQLINSHGENDLPSGGMWETAKSQAMETYRKDSRRGIPKRGRSSFLAIGKKDDSLSLGSKMKKSLESPSLSVWRRGDSLHSILRVNPSLGIWKRGDSLMRRFGRKNFGKDNSRRSLVREIENDAFGMNRKDEFPSPGMWEKAKSQYFGKREFRNSILGKHGKDEFPSPAMWEKAKNQYFGKRDIRNSILGKHGKDEFPSPAMWEKAKNQYFGKGR